MIIVFKFSFKVVVAVLFISLPSWAQKEWTKQSLPNDEYMVVMGLAWTGNRIVATCDSMPHIFVSNDGVEWKERGEIAMEDYPLNAGGYSIIWDGNRLLTSGYVSNDEGETWETFYGGYGTCILYDDNNDQYFAAGWGDSVYSSSDGEMWASHPLNDFCSLFSIAYNGERYIAVGGSWSEPDIVTSTDGETWEIVKDHGVETPLRSVIYTGKKLIAAGDSGAIYTSADGLSWTRQESGTTARLLCAAWLDSTLYVTGDSGILLTSKDGIEWDMNRIDSAGLFYCITFTGTQFIVGGSNGNGGIIYTSPKEGLASYTARPFETNAETVRKKQMCHTVVPFGRSRSTISGALLLSGRKINRLKKNQKPVVNGTKNIYIYPGSDKTYSGL